MKYGALSVLSIVVLVTLLLWTGLADRWARSAVVSQVEKMSGGRVELKTFRFTLFGLRVEMDDFTVHGREPEGTPPFFHTDRLIVDMRLESLLRRKVVVDEVILERPTIHVRLDENGVSNVPQPQPSAPRQPGTPVMERLFDLRIGKVRLDNGEMVFNNVRTPLVAEGGELNFALDYQAPNGGPERYVGDFSWRGMSMVARRYLPFNSDVAAKFTLTRESFTLDDFQWKLPQSQISASAALPSLAARRWEFRYQGALDLSDLRGILRKPNMPNGHVQFSGQGTFADGNLDLRGRYNATRIALPYVWFHTTGIESSGDYYARNKNLEITNFRARAVGGVAQGRVDLEYAGMKFRAQTRITGMSLAAILAAVDHPGFPVTTLHWDSRMDMQAVTTWSEDFKHVESKGVVQAAPPGELAENMIPVTGVLDYDYSLDAGRVQLRQSSLITPSSRLEMDGILGARDSALNVKMSSGDLLPWNDFIYALRGPEADRQPIAGRVEFAGRMDGRLDSPTFSGHVQGYQAAYGKVLWDEVRGDLTYSPRVLRLERASARRGRSSVSLELWMELDSWGFRPGNQWTLTADLERAPTDELQSLLGVSYPVSGLLTGQFRGRGTRANPEISGLVDIAEVQAWGVRFDRARGQFVLNSNEVRVNNAEIRKATGRITGNFRYGFSDRQVAFDATGAVVPIERLEFAQAPNLDLAGQLSFQIRGSGPLAAPRTEGSLRIVDFKVGHDVFGSFETKLRSDGRELSLDISSQMSEGSLNGKIEMTLGGDYPIKGDLTARGIDLDAFIENALKLKALTGHSHVDGRFVLTGWLARPKTITVRADISRLVFDYQYVKLENEGPIRFVYSGEEVRVEQAHIKGNQTDFTVSGFARFAGDRRLNLALAGQVNLQLLGGFVRDLDARGGAQINADITGTAASPRITGRMRVENAAANYAEFPAGLSNMQGEFVFDQSRMLFENVTAEAGGGRLAVSGSVTYGEGPLRYDLSIYANRVRIRYPEGMSWLLGGRLRFSGGTTSGLISGNLVIHRLLMTRGFDLATLIVLSQDRVSVPTTSSPFLRNLQFDIEATSAADARVEWNAARFESEAKLRVRGTWEHPILLGHIHLLSGEMAFRGNRYRVTRGDINFSNPFNIDPELNIEAITEIRQYEVTLNFTGKASKLNLAYRSDPPLPPSDVIALLALGRTGEESELRTSGSGQGSPEAGATQLLGEAISSQLGGRIERLFGVSRFKIDPFLAGTGTEQNATARITIEQQLTRDLVITYITNVSSTQQQVIQVEYAVSREISIVALRDQNGTFGLDVKFKKRFK